MRIRGYAALAVVVAGVLAAPAEAKPAKPVAKVCRLVVDDTGDGMMFLVVPETTGALDLVSADVATGVRTLTVAMRFASLAPDTKTTFGVQYTFEFTVNGNPWWLRYRRQAGRSDEAGYGEGTPGFAAGSANWSVDTQTATVYMSLPRAVIKGIAKSKIGNMHPTAYINNGAFFTEIDDAVSTAMYVDRTPSCVAPA